MGAGAAYTLLFDSECRVCSAFARMARRLDVRRRLQVRPIQESNALLAAVPPAVWYDAAHMVAPDGRVTSGSDAMPSLVAAIVAGPRFERRLRGSRACMAALGRVYGIMVATRTALTCAVAAPAGAGRSPR